MKPRALSASTLTGTNVENLQGDKIGRIKDLMFDLENVQVLYALVARGGFLGLADEYFAVPIQTFTFSERDDDLIKMDVDKETLERAPGFNKDKTGPPHHHVILPTLCISTMAAIGTNYKHRSVFHKEK